MRMLVDDVREIDSLRSHVAARDVESQQTEREMWAAIGRLADAYQSLVCQVSELSDRVASLRRLLIWCIAVAVVSAVSSLACVGGLLWLILR